jgi:Lon-like ATP-dependent protease
VTAKIEAAARSGVKTIVVPRANMQDVLLDDRFEKMVEVLAVDTLDEVMQYALIKHEQKAGLVERLEAVIDRLTPEVQSKISLV